MISTVLGREGFDYDVAEDGEAACHKLRRREYDVIVLDLMLPKMNGFEVIRFLKADRPAMLARVIVVTAVAEATLRDFDDEKLVWRLLRKPFDIAELVSNARACAAASEERRLVRRAAERVG